MNLRRHRVMAATRSWPAQRSGASRPVLPRTPRWSPGSSPTELTPARNARSSGRRVRRYGPEEPRASGAWVLLATVNLCRHPTAVLTSLSAPCAFAELAGVLARVLRSPRADCRTGLPAPRAGDPEPPAHPALRRMPGIRARLILGSCHSPEGPASVATDAEAL
jgi:hypothetical protein